MAEDFKNIVEDAGYPVKIIQGTADYYCRDYMPLQVSKYDFMQFEFKPEKYLEENEYKYISDPVKIQKEIVASQLLIEEEIKRMQAKISKQLEKLTNQGKQILE